MTICCTEPTSAMTDTRRHALLRACRRAGGGSLALATWAGALGAVQAQAVVDLYARDPTSRAGISKCPASRITLLPAQQELPGTAARPAGAALRCAALASPAAKACAAGRAGRGRSRARSGRGLWWARTCDSGWGGGWGWGHAPSACALHRVGSLRTCTEQHDS